MPRSSEPSIPLSEVKAELFKALGHPARVRILEVLSDGEHSVGEMHTSTSCGVATMLPEDTVHELIGAADEALYQAKSNGRNRTEIAARGSNPAAVTHYTTLAKSIIDKRSSLGIFTSMGQVTSVPNVRPGTT